MNYNHEHIFPLSCFALCSAGIVHENVKMGSDGESDQASGTSSDEVQSPVRVRMRNNHHRRISTEVRENTNSAANSTHERFTYLTPSLSLPYMVLKLRTGIRNGSKGKCVFNTFKTIVYIYNIILLLEK